MIKSAMHIPAGASIYHPVEKRRLCVFVGWCDWDKADNDPTEGEYRLYIGQDEDTYRVCFNWFQGLLDAGAVVIPA